MIACWVELKSSHTLMLKDLLTLLLFSRRIVVWLLASLPPLFSRFECWVVFHCPFSVALYPVWSLVVASVFQVGLHVRHPSDLSSACLSSRHSSLVLEWHRIRDLDRVSGGQFEALNDLYKHVRLERLEQCCLKSSCWKLKGPWCLYLESMANFLEQWLWLLAGLLLLLFPWSLRLLSILLAAAVLAFLLWWEYLWGMAASVCVCVCAESSGTNTLFPVDPKPNGEGRSRGQLENWVRAVWLHQCV